MMMENWNYWTFNLSPYAVDSQEVSFIALITILSMCVGFYLFLSHSYAKQKITDKYLFIVKIPFFYMSVFLSFLLFSKIFGISFRPKWYGIGMITAVLLIYSAFQYWIKQKKIMLTNDLLNIFILYSTGGVFIGARLGYVFIYNWHVYKNSLLSIFAIWSGGLSFHGGLIGFGFSVLIFAKRYNISFYHLVDKVSCIMPLGIMCGRFGNFMNGELWGREVTSSLPWAIIFPRGGSVPRHPSQIYAFLTEGFLLFCTIAILSKKYKMEGALFSFSIFFYSFYRFFIEYFRAADAQLNYLHFQNLLWAPITSFTPWWAVLTMGQILCIVGMITGIVLYQISKNNILEGSNAWIKRHKNFSQRFKTPKINTIHNEGLELKKT